MNLIRRIRAAASLAFAPSAELESVMEAASFGEGVSVGDPHGIIVRHFGGETSRAGVPMNHRLAMQIPAVFAAIGIVSDAVGQLPLVLYRQTEEGRIPATEHKVFRLLKRTPNPEMGAMTFKSMLQAHICGWGNGYAEIQRDGFGTARNLWPLLPDRTAPERQRGALRYRSSVENNPARPIDLPAEDVLHVPALGFNGLVGWSPITQAREGLAMATAMEKFGGEFFKNEARSGGFILHPAQLSKTAKKNIVDSVADQRRGDPLAEARGKRDTGAGSDESEHHRIKVLEEGMKFVPTTISPEDSQFLLSREFQVGEIARMFRVPLVMLQAHTKDTSWGSGIEQIMIGFVVWTITPWLIRWEEELNRKLLTEEELEAGYAFKFNVNGLLRGDMKTRAEFYKSGIEAGWLTRQQAREFEEFNRLAGLDAPLVPLNHASVSPTGEVIVHTAPKTAAPDTETDDDKRAADEIARITEDA